MRKRKGFLERLTGAIQIDDRNFDDFDDFDDDEYTPDYDPQATAPQQAVSGAHPANAAQHQTAISHQDEPLTRVQPNYNQAPPAPDQYASQQPVNAYDQGHDLDVDVFETDEHIIIKTVVPGVHPDDIDISITRDNVIISGRRDEDYSADEVRYVHQELYWGEFSRSIKLPQEIIIEEADAVARHGLLSLKLPKIDHGREAKVKVQVG